MNSSRFFHCWLYLDELKKVFRSIISFKIRLPGVLHSPHFLGEKGPGGVTCDVHYSQSGAVLVLVLEFAFVHNYTIKLSIYFI